MAFADDVRAVLARLGPGEVVTYGEVAEESGHPGAARAVGNLLARGDEEHWWRVIAASGHLVCGNGAEQARRLRAEGVEVRDGRVRRGPPAPPGRAAATPRSTSGRSRGR